MTLLTARTRSSAWGLGRVGLGLTAVTAVALLAAGCGSAASVGASAGSSTTPTGSPTASTPAAPVSGGYGLRRAAFSSGHAAPAYTGIRTRHGVVVAFTHHYSPSRAQVPLVAALQRQDLPRGSEVSEQELIGGCEALLLRLPAKRVPAGVSRHVEVRLFSKDGYDPRAVVRATVTASSGSGLGSC